MDKEDYKKILLASFFGVGLTMFAFFKGLSLTTPISASVMMVTSPIMALLFSSILIRSTTEKRRILEVFIGLLGAILLITFGSSSNANNKIVAGAIF